MRSILSAAMAASLLLAVPAAAQAQTATGTSASGGAHNPGTPPSGGQPGGGPDTSASPGTTKTDQALERKNDKVQSICKGC